MSEAANSPELQAKCSAGVLRPQKLERLDALEGLRSIAFFLIFLSHCDDKWGRFGAVGVSTFFFLSGFLMAYSYLWRDRIPEKPSLRYCITFGMRKVSKLYPLHLLVLASGVVLFRNGLFGSSLYKFVTGCLKCLLDAALLQSWFPKSSVYFSLNGPAWYLSVSLFLYACFPLIAKRLERDPSGLITKALPVAIWVVQFFVAWIVRDTHSIPYISDDLHKYITYIFPVYRLGDFVIGCCLGSLFVRHKETANASEEKRLDPAKDSFLEAAALCFFIITAYIMFKGDQIAFLQGYYWWRYDVLFTWSSCAIIWALSAGSGVISRLFKTEPLVWIGSLSAFGFLLHVRVIALVKKIIELTFGDQGDVDVLVLTAAAFAATLFACFIWQQLDTAVQRALKQKRAKA